MKRFSLDEAITTTRDELFWLGRLQERYPKAEQIRLPDGRGAWANSTIEPTGFLVSVVTDEDDLEYGAVLLCPYEDVDDTPVFALRPAWQRAAPFFERLREHEPETFKTLLGRFGQWP